MRVEEGSGSPSSTLGLNVFTSADLPLVSYPPPVSGNEGSDVDAGGLVPILAPRNPFCSSNRSAVTLPANEVDWTAKEIASHEVEKKEKESIFPG